MFTHPEKTIFMGGDLQATVCEEDTRSHHAPLRKYCEESRLDHITPRDINTFIPYKPHLDHWFLRCTIKPAHYTQHKYNHLHLGIWRPQGPYPRTTTNRRCINTRHKQTHSNPTTRSHQPFILPIPQHLVDIYRITDSETTPPKQIHKPPNTP
jgi:hypothetical protein